MNYYHTLFNQRVKSQIELPEADSIEKTDEIDIEVILGRPPEWVFDLIEKGEYDYISKDIMWFHLEELAIYYVENGNRIIVFKETDEMTELQLRSFLTGTAFALALMQKELIPIHGGAVISEGKGVIISGTSGSGKSTISMALIQKGYDFLTDDISVIDLKEGKSWLLPGFPQQKVCRDAISQFHLEESELIFIDEDRDKFARRLYKGYVNHPVEIKCMIEIIASDSATQVEFKEMTGVEKIHQLMNNVYRGEVFQRMENNSKILKNFLSIAAEIKMFQIIRPQGVNSIDEIVDRIQSVLS